MFTHDWDGPGEGSRHHRPARDSGGAGVSLEDVLGNDHGQFHDFPVHDWALDPHDLQ